MSSTAKEIRALAQKLREEVRASPAYACSWEIVENCASHLDAVARSHEFNEMEASRRRECTSSK